MKTYSLKRNEEEITLETEPGSAEILHLREMTAADRDKYLDRLTKRLKLGTDGQSQGVNRFDGLQADLISSCLWRGEALVTKQEVQAWPAAAVQGIFNDAQEINKLGADHAEETAKNE
jgi:hypothetical protein